MKRYLSFIIGLLMASVLQAQHIIFTPQWLPQAQFAGYYVAQEKGFYKDEGLDVEFKHPSASYPAINRMMDGNCHIVTLQLLQAMTIIDRGFKLVSILQTSQHNSLLFVPRSNSVKTIEDLRNKRVGIWKVGFGETAKVLNKVRNLNIEWIEHLQGINLLISGAIDATLAMRYNEYWLIMASGIQPDNVFHLSDYGMNVPEDGLYVSETFYKEHPEKAKAFARASKRGWEWARNHPEEALDIVIKVMKRARVTTNIHHQRWMLNEILQLNCDEALPEKVVNNQLKIDITTKGEASYQLKPEQLKLANDLLLKGGIISTPIEYEQFWKGGEL